MKGMTAGILDALAQGPATTSELRATLCASRAMTAEMLRQLFLRRVLTRAPMKQGRRKVWLYGLRESSHQEATPLSLKPCVYWLKLAIDIQRYPEREWPALVDAITDEEAKGPVWAWLCNHGRGSCCRGGQRESERMSPLG